MIVALVDDLMLRSRVKAAASVAGADVRFASDEASALTLAALAPALIVVDLNARRVDSVGLVARLKREPALRALRVLGFVAHVDAPTIAAARDAGIDEVLARGAFVSQLPALLATASRQSGDGIGS